MPKEYSCVKRTKKAFERSLSELSREMPLNKVTVKLLCERAQLSRNAFYFHYSDINDLERDIEDRVIGEIVSNLSELRRIGFPENIFISVKTLIDILDENRETVLMLFDKSYSVSFTRRLGVIFSEFNYEYYKEYNPNGAKESYELFYAFLSGGFYDCIRMWLENHNRIAKEDVTRITYKMVKRLISPVDPDLDKIIKKR